MPIHRGLKVVFVHVPRTGGTSIEKMLGIYGDWPTCRMDIFHGLLRHDGEELQLQHLPLDTMRELSGEEFSGWYKFAFVRNPWERLVSHYCWKAEKRIRKHGKGAIEPFDAYIDRVERIVTERDNILGLNCHLRPQVEFISNDLDFIGRFESFQTDIVQVMKDIGILREMHHEYKTSHNYYTEYYNNITAKKISDIYAFDIERFGYKFGE